jgi:nicotinate-nucleotide adenylyltransferase
MSRVGLFGGSFDPIHAGHVAPVRAARQQLGLDVVWFVPTARPPHKPDRRFAPAQRRFAMVELALLAEPGLLVSDVEMVDRPCYTVETLERFRAAEPGADLHLLVGSDSLAALPSWRRWRELPALARLVVLARPGWDMAEVLPRLPAELAAAAGAGRLVAVRNEPVPVSSTAVREALARGVQPPPGSVHPLVLDYARKYRLYDETTPPL